MRHYIILLHQLSTVVSTPASGQPLSCRVWYKTHLNHLISVFRITRNAQRGALWQVAKLNADGITESSHKMGNYCITRNVMEFGNFWMNKGHDTKIKTWYALVSVNIKPQKYCLNRNPACSACLCVNECEFNLLHILKCAWHLFSLYHLNIGVHKHKHNL